MLDSGNGARGVGLARLTIQVYDHERLYLIFSAFVAMAHLRHGTQWVPLCLGGFDNR